MNHETNLSSFGTDTDSTRNDGYEEIYGGEISVLDRSWAKEINHMLCSCVCVHVRSVSSLAVHYDF